MYGGAVHACKTQGDTQSLCGQTAPAHQCDSGETASLAPIDLRNCEYRRARMKRCMVMTNGKELGWKSRPSIAPAGCMNACYSVRKAYAFVKSDTARHPFQNLEREHAPQLHRPVQPSSPACRKRPAEQHPFAHSAKAYHHPHVRQLGKGPRYGTQYMQVSYERTTLSPTRHHHRH